MKRRFYLTKHINIKNVSLRGILGWCLSVLVFLLPVLICLQIVLRSVFHASFFGMEEVVLFLGSWLFFLGIAYASDEGTHVVVTLLPSQIKFGRVVFKTDKVALFAGVCTILITIYALYLATNYWWSVCQDWLLSTPLQIPLVYLYASMVVGLGLSAISLVRNLVANVGNARGKE